MIACLSVIVYIVTAVDEVKGKKILQKGQAVSKLNKNGDHQIYNYIAWLPLPDDSEDESQDDEEYEVIRPFEEKKIYQVNGKFSVSANDSIDLVVSTSIQLQIEETPISRPVVHLVGHVQAPASIVESGYHLSLQVKPYLSAEQSGSFTIILTHPIEGRFKKSFNSAKRFSLIHCTGVLIIIGSSIYCDILEFQFMGNKTEKQTTITVPWKKNSESSNKGEASTKKFDSFEKRINEMHQKILQSPPTPANKIANPKSKVKGKEKEGTLKVGEIAKSTLKQKRSRRVSESKVEENEETNAEDVSVKEMEDTISPIEEVDALNEPPSKRTRNKS
jgi:hypothetical protein